MTYLYELHRCQAAQPDPLEPLSIELFIVLTKGKSQIFITSYPSHVDIEMHNLRREASFVRTSEEPLLLYEATDAHTEGVAATYTRWTISRGVALAPS